MTQAIDTVVFDVGNVLIRWDPNILFDKIMPSADEKRWFLENVCTSEWNAEQDRGRCWEDGIDELLGEFPDHEDLIRAYSERWHEMVPGPIEGSVSLLKELKDKEVPLYCITNFSDEKFTEAQDRFPFLKESFLNIVVSAHEKVLKPSPRIYEILFERNDLDPSRAVFIDDSPANVEGSKQVGMHALHFTGADKLRMELRAHGFPV
ncbi:MAG: HAD family phosphatase [Stappiaceae bacterium]